ncbi:FtsW/RodA/SpoVE family cell cycle protein [Paenibacillus radicis (ex Gao et al. 2016)]|uniref:Cell division protein FtsW n=1 Tax=Paenibacillus radicis (ex Gao et al. 2016) TaxID=1737354 RepID=A0A917MBY4_9BACL|nr:FtsW/RodA/SpoVE family cell cycle protein [Paenibacillus radicis (ex Gao et al. 2016)]GGG90987.1 cell division protein FtsW [Paenibacillus radicis (ex Gao et al. 2016)]
MSRSAAIQEHEVVRLYLRRVCGHIKAKSVHSDIQQELLAHLEELVEEKEQEGYGQKEAIRLAVAQMGDPDDVGRQFHQAHKPRANWGLLALVAVFVAIALTAMYSVQLAGNQRMTTDFLVNKMVYIGIGLGIMAGLYFFFDYRKLQKYSWHLYGLTVLVMIVLAYFGNQVNGKKGWISIPYFTFDGVWICLHLFILSIIGILLRSSEKAATAGKGRRIVYGLKDMLFCFVLPCLLFLSMSTHTYLFIYLTCLVIVMTVYVRRWLLLSSGMLAAVVMLGLYLLFDRSFQYILSERLSSFLKLTDNPDSTYMTRMSVQAIHDGGLWGQGFGVSNRTLPFIHSEMIFTYLTYSMGWVMAGLILTVVIMFMAQIGIMISRLRDRYAKGLVIGLFSILCLQFLWCIGMSFGWLPMTEMRLPFISYGGTSTLLELSAIGLFLSAYRRKDMIPSPSQPLQT